MSAHRHLTSAREFFGERFRDNLISARRRSGLTQEELGARAGIGGHMVRLLESGDRSPQLETALRLADSMDEPLDRLVLDIEWLPAELVTRGGDYVRPRRPHTACR
jgi:transcriptional regulator with XRE-family HTH domain